MWKCKAAVGYLMMLLEGLMLCPKGILFYRRRNDYGHRDFYPV